MEKRRLHCAGMETASPNKPLLRILVGRKLFIVMTMSAVKKDEPTMEWRAKSGKERERSGEGGALFSSISLMTSLDNDAPCFAQGGAFFAAHSND
jgi:hypothetical protein